MRKRGSAKTITGKKAITAVKKMGGAYHHDRHRPFSVFFVKHSLVAVRPEIKPTDPRRCPSHLLTDGIQGYSHAAFDDEFIVDVAADEAVRERPHGVHEDVS